MCCIPSLSLLTYPEHLDELKLEFLEASCLTNNYIMLFSIIIGLIYLNFRDFFTNRLSKPIEHTLPRINDIFLCHPIFSHNVHKYIFTVRDVNNRNRLPNDIVSWASLSSIKNAYLFLNTNIL